MTITTVFSAFFNDFDNKEVSFYEYAGSDALLLTISVLYETMRKDKTSNNDV